MAEPQQSTDPRSSSRRRILVVDDDPSLRLLLRETLAAGEFELEETASAEEARDVARFWRPSVVLLDVTLPGLDGLSFCKQLTGGGVLKEPAVILLTGTEMSDKDARAAGARAYLAKPFSPLELISLIDMLDALPNDLLISNSDGDSEQLLLYARDLNRVVEVVTVGCSLDPREGRGERVATPAPRGCGHSRRDDPSREGTATRLGAWTS